MTAITCARTIVMEMFEKEKTLKSLSSMGAAGGEKFVFKNIFFKLGTDE